MNISKKAVLATIVAVIGASSFTWAADNKVGASPDASKRQDSGAMSAPSPLNTLTGVVEKIDNANKSIQLQDVNGVTQTLKIGMSTEITRDGLAVQLVELKKGETVTIKNSTTPL